MSNNYNLYSSINEELINITDKPHNYNLDKSIYISQNKLEKNNDALFNRPLGVSTKDKTNNKFKTTLISKKENVDFLGKKRKIHTKSQKDNISKKFISFFLKILLAFINQYIRDVIAVDKDIKNLIIKEFKNDNFKENVALLKIDIQKEYNKSLQFNKLLLDQKLEYIFSKNISTKYKEKNYSKDYNQNLIKFLKKNNNLKALFEITFYECFKHINGIENNDVLNGHEQNGLKNGIIEIYNSALKKYKGEEYYQLKMFGRFFICYFKSK